MIWECVAAGIENVSRKTSTTHKHRNKFLVEQQKKEARSKRRKIIIIITV